MGAIFAQLYGLALPIRMSLGDEYTPAQLESLVMQLVVIVLPQSNSTAVTSTSSSGTN